MADVRIRVGAPYEVTAPDRRQAAERLVKDARESGHTVELEVIEYVPGRRGLGPFEGIALFIAGGVSSTVLGLVVTDLYNLAKRWATDRQRERETRGAGGNGTEFTIYGPDGEVLRRWNTRDGDS